ncbi:MAG: sterol desaturase, partial [Candidatus Marinimicrobia bacterium]|nr:sterol desaturase [Candidatus Neomarinimicrobiota bacterium]
DKNYGNIFSIWDHLFKTASSYQVNNITYGVDTHMDKKETSRIGTMMMIPFQKYRFPVGSKFSE